MSNNKKPKRAKPPVVHSEEFKGLEHVGKLLDSAEKAALTHHPKRRNEMRGKGFMA